MGLHDTTETSLQWSHTAERLLLLVYCTRQTCLHVFHEGTLRLKSTSKSPVFSRFIILGLFVFTLFFPLYHSYCDFSCPPPPRSTNLKDCRSAVTCLRAQNHPGLLTCIKSLYSFALSSQFSSSFSSGADCSKSPAFCLMVHLKGAECWSL